MADKAWSGNVGEWGEIYAACALLGAGQLSIAERPKPYQLLDLQRPEKQGSASYVVDGGSVTPSSIGTKIPRSQYADAAIQIRAAIQNPQLQKHLNARSVFRLTRPRCRATRR